MTNNINIYFFGDIVGRPARKGIDNFLNGNKFISFDKEKDFIIVNVENASHGFGLTEKNYNELANLPIDAMTSGNHIWDKKEIFTYIETADKLIRPLNYPEGTAGVGTKIIEKNGVKLGIINLLGRVFMDTQISPWLIIKEEVEKIKSITPNVLIDFHAEASAEKICFGKYCSELGVSAVLGTHTHVQTADEKILNDRTAYITDVGFCGSIDSVIGMKYDGSLKKMLTSMPERYDVADDGDVQINGVKIVLNSETGAASEIKRISEIIYDED